MIKRFKKLSKRSALLSLVALLLIVIGVVLALSNKPNEGSGTIPTLPIPKTSTDSSTDGQQPSPNSAKTSPASPTNSTLPLTAPFGSFVSNHYPNLSGNPRPSKVESQCVVQPGATCYIEFSKDGVIKKLEEQTAGISGIIYWNWDVKEAGLTPGSWKITALAKMGGLSEQAVDSIALEVKQ